MSLVRWRERRRLHDTMVFGGKKETGWENLEAGHAAAEDVSCKAEGGGKL